MRTLKQSAGITAIVRRVNCPSNARDNMRFCGLVTIAMAGMLINGGSLHAQGFLYFWNNPAGGSYNSNGNWLPFGVPNDLTEGAVFELNSTYTVTFPTSVTTSLAEVSLGFVTFDLDSSGTPRTYTVAELNVNGSGTPPWLYVDDGTVNATSSTTVGGSAGGVMVIRPGGTVTTPTAILGDTGTATLYIQNVHQLGRQDGVFTTGSATLGKAATGAGTADVYGVWNTGPLIVGDAGDGYLEIHGATTIDTGPHTYGGRVYSSTASIAAQSGSLSDVYVHGMVFQETSDIGYWRMADNLYVGGNDQSAGGTGSLTIGDLGVVDVDGFVLVHPDGAVSVNAGGTLSAGTGLGIDGGSVEIQSGGAFNLAAGVGVNPINGGNFTAQDLFTLDNDNFFKVGNGGTMNFPGGLDIGLNGGGGMMIDDPGSMLSAGDCVWGNNHASASVFLINEAVMETGDLRLAYSDLSGTDAHVQIITGGDMTTNGILRLAPTGGATTSATLIVDGAGSSFTQNDNSPFSIRVGHSSTGSALIHVRNGGLFTTGTGETTVRATGEVRIETGAVIDARGPINIEGGQFNFLGGTLHVGEFIGNLDNQGGSLAPGHSAGLTTITGDYTQQSAAALAIEIGGIDNSDPMSPQYDAVSVGGTATLNGLLNVSLLEDFPFFGVSQFTVLTATSVVDNGLVLGGPAAGMFTMLVNSTSVVLQVVENGLSGDYNNDGILDGADYTVWRDALTAGATELLNDSTPGAVDESDFLYWRDHFGQSLGGGAGSAAAVPEPGGATLLILGGIVAFWFRRLSW